MVKAFFDTNILIDYLSGIEAARTEIERYEERSISIITWMEVLVGVKSEADALIRAWLESFAIVHIDVPIADRAVSIRKRTRIKLPDAIVWASAQLDNALLVTRNTKDFSPDDPSVRVPYQI
jgi:predicted nucleic acid-binding protein